MSSFRSPLAVTRFTPGSYINGDWQEGTRAEIAIQASAQPLNPKEMESLPEGRRDSQAVKIYPDTELFTVRDDTNPDLVEYRGEVYEVISVAPHQSGVIDHFKAVAVLREEES